jgi:ribose transport system substrate-binding protein
MVCGLMLVIGAGLTACGSSDSDSGSTSTSGSSSSTATGAGGSVSGQEIAYLVPSMDITYWQWVKEGVEQEAKRQGLNVTTYDATNSPAKQAENANTALTKGAKGIVLSPVSSSSAPTVLNAAERQDVPVTFAAIGPDPSVTNYASLITSDDYTSGKEAGAFLAEEVKKLGGNEVGLLALPLDRTNAKAKLKGLQESLDAAGVKLVQTIQTQGLTVREAVSEANDLLTAHPNIKGIYGMYDNAGIGAVKVLQTRGLEGKVAIVSSDGSPETIGDVRKGLIKGIVVQEAVGQGIEATKQLAAAMAGKPVKKSIPLPEPLVTQDNIDEPKIQEILKLVYPPSAGAY